MTPQELKYSILQLAIQGKLVEQRPEEGTAEELYQRIQKEKKKLIKAGKIKKGKPLPEITENEIPFDIPESWMWVRLGDCSSYSQRKEKVNASNITPDMWSLDLEDIEKETGRIIRRCKASERTIAGDKVCFHKGQVLYSKLRPYLKKVLVAHDDGVCSPEMVPFAPYGNIDTQYLVYVLTSPHIDYIINSVTYGVKMPRVGTDTMTNLLFPLPPLAEQKRIVAKIEELLPYIDRYEKAWNRLEDLNKRFPADMQKSILQMAIQGKLVEQRPEEGTAEELYQQIQAEKQKLIKEGKIKKEKTLPEITEDEIPFDIPDSWKWVRLSQLFSVLNGDRGKNYPAKSTLSHEGIPFISALNLDGKSVIEDDNLLRLSEQQYERLGNGKLIRDDIVVCIRGSLGKHGRYPFDKGAIASSLVILRAFTNDDILAEFLMMYLDTPLFFSEIRRYDNGTAQPNLAAKSLEQFLVPLPPLAEQKRIVAKLEEILPLCEKLK